MTTEEELKIIDEKIRSLADAYLASGRPYFLSKLGQDLGDDLRHIKIGLGKSLGAYISERLSGEYSIVITGEHKNVQALIRSSGIVLSPLLSELPPQNTDIQPPPPPRYNYRFWAAFSVPLKAGTRWLNMEDFTFKDSGERPAENYEEIDAEYIAPAETPERDKLVLSNIARWLEKMSLPRERFVAQASRMDARTASMKSRSLLELFVDALDRKQLAATTLSLDVVADLLRKRI